MFQAGLRLCAHRSVLYGLSLPLIAPLVLLWRILTLLFYRAVYRPYEALPIRFA